MRLKPMLAAAVLAVLGLTACGAAPPPRRPAQQAQPKYFASCSIPVWGDVPAAGAHGTRGVFAEATRASKLKFYSSAHDPAARYGIRIVYRGWRAVPYAYTTRYNNVGGSGHNSWLIEVWGTPERSLVRHEIGHVYNLGHDPLAYRTVMSPTVYGSNTGWQTGHKNVMRFMAGASGCN